MSSPTLMCKVIFYFFLENNPFLLCEHYIKCEITKKGCGVKMKTEDAREIHEFWDHNGFGSQNSWSKQQLLLWLNDLHFVYPKQMILKALEIACINHNRRFFYVDGVLRNWKSDNIKRVEDLQCYEERKEVDTTEKYSVDAETGKCFPEQFKLDVNVRTGKEYASCYS
ncbi:DnaD domain protein [Bacillus sp. BGMRC 2118]|nr:DnaD domain protein [Bacillus sp. BGMRC 2118]